VKVKNRTIPDGFKIELKGQVGDGLVGIIKSDIGLKTAGAGKYKACCPFHDEKTGSFYVLNGSKGWHFHCFGCGASGDVFDWYMHRHGMTYPDAVEHVAKMYGLELPGVSPEQKQQDERVARLRQIVSTTAAWMHNALFSADGSRAREYLEKRSITHDEARTFQLGYAPGNARAWADLAADFMTQRGFSRAELVASGVFRQEDKGPLRSFFSDRLMFTICDHSGRPVGFSGRKLDDSREGPKYINSEDGVIFSKGGLVYNAHRAQEVSRTTGQAIVVVEGYTDVIALERTMSRPVVCCMGTALTDRQAEAIWRLHRSESLNMPVLCFDGDEAGQKAAIRASRLLLPLLTTSRSARFAMLHHSQDPASLVAQEGGIERMQAVLEGAITGINLLYQDTVVSRQPLDTPEAIVSLEKVLKESILDKIQDPDIRRGYAEHIRRRIGDLRVKFHSQRRPPPCSTLPMPRMPGEAAILATLMNHPDLFAEFAEDLTRTSFENFRDLKTDLVDSLSQALDDEDSQRIVRDLIERHDVAHVVLSQATMAAAPFARPEAAAADARAGVMDILHVMEAERLKEEVKRLMQQVDGTPRGSEIMRQVQGLLESIQSSVCPT
jgi:DNA primase